MEQTELGEATANGQEPEKPGRRRRVVSGEKPAQAKRKAKKQTPLQEAAAAEPKLKALAERVEKLSKDAADVAKERAKLIDGLSDAAARYLGVRA